MNILLIDDQPNIISSLVAGIPWYELGFTSIFTATSALAAREILQKNIVDIVVSDIEMPGEDGISLLTWARAQGLDYECILLTAHADFTYAQKAISLRVSEYVIQPAKNEDIIQAVIKAKQKRLGTGTAKQKTSADNFNYAAQNIVIKTLFEEWPTIEASVIHPELINSRIAQLKQFGIECTPASPCVIFLIRTRKWTKLPLSASDFLVKYQKLLEDVFDVQNMTNISYYMNDNMFCTILFTSMSDTISTGISVLFKEIPKKIGVSVRLLYASAEIRFIRNTLDGIINAENQYSLKHFDDVKLIEINQQDLYASAVGSENYEHYNKLIHEYIQSHIAESICRADIADYLHLSPDNVSYIIKLTENLSVKELVKRIKMEHAKRMLRNTQYTISEIALKCGYDSFAYFSKVYRDTFGITPSQERH